MEVLWVFLWGVVALAVKAAVVLFVLFTMLTWNNNKNGVNVKEMLKKLDADPRAVAEYYGSRLRAAAIVVGCVAIGSLL